jgi:hypothetical protein
MELIILLELDLELKIGINNLIDDTSEPHS